MFRLQQSKNNQYYFTLRSVNGRVLMTSETYTTRAMARKGIAAVLAAAIRAEKHETQDHTAIKMDPGWKASEVKRDRRFAKRKPADVFHIENKKGKIVKR